MIDERFSRLALLFGEERMEALRTARVAVFGLGGVGGSCVEALVRGGVGQLVLVDGDSVEASNMNRQTIARESTIGMRKVDAAAAMVRDISPTCEMHTVDCFLNPEDVAPLLNALCGIGECNEKPADCAAAADVARNANHTAAVGSHLDFIVDCIDALDTKIALALWAQENGVPIVSCMGTARKLDPLRFEFADIYDTHVCPLCRVMRRKARAAGIASLTVLYSQEPPLEQMQQARQPDQPQNQPLGTASFVPPIAGMLLAGHTITALSRM